MKIIHTSDWHLGQKLLYNDREEEHRLALDWLLETIKAEKADGLLVSGDIFDIGNPPNYARSLYYSFLRRLLGTSCRQVVITAGNHDSPAMLNAPRELLQALNVHVVGAAGESPEEEVVEWRNEAGQLQALIAAVPFLRDRDLRYSIAGETGLDRIAQLRLAIKQHYENLAEWMQAQYPAAEVPVLAMGHLYATGAQASGKQDNIYIGNTENIAAQHFPDYFSYIALGHIHRAQEVGGLAHVRYSGSLIPLSFSETKDDKSVYLLEYEGAQLKDCRTLTLPVFRRLKTIAGSLEEVKEKLRRFAQKEREGLPPWLEVKVTLDRMVPDLHSLLQDEAGALGLKLLKVQAEYPHRHQAATADPPDLHSLEVEDVFRMKCETLGSPPEEMDELMDTFRELQNWMQEADDPETERPKNKTA